MATEMLGAIFAFQNMFLLQRCVRNVVLSTNGHCYGGESSRKCKYMPDMKYGASNCIPLHMEHKVMISGTSWQLFCRKTQSFMLTLVWFSLEKTQCMPCINYISLDWHCVGKNRSYCLYQDICFGHGQYKDYLLNLDIEMILKSNLLF